MILSQPVAIGSDVIDGHTQRIEIDQLDATIADLLKRRAFVSGQVQRARVRLGGARVDLGREREVIDTYIAKLGARGSDIADTVLTYCRGELADAVRDERQGSPVHAIGVGS